VVLARVRDLVIITLVPLVFVVVSPWNNLDGINPAKFLVVVSLGAISFSLSIFRVVEMLKSRTPDLFQLASLIAVALIFLSISINRYSIDERLFGVFGRSLGAITFISLFLLSTSSAILGLQNLKLFNLGLVLSLVSVAGYFALQLGGLDPASWGDPYGGVPSSTLGNPNFVSSSLALLSVPMLALLFFSRTRWGLLPQSIVFLVLAVTLYLIRETRSIQGILIFATTFATLLFIRINDSFSNRFSRLIKAITISSVTAVPVITFLIAAGQVPQMGGATVIARTEYWRSAWNLILDNPLFGTGFDSFGDWYLHYRDQLAIDRSLGLFSDSTHNLILELGVFGGFPLLLVYAWMQALALKGDLGIWT